MWWQRIGVVFAAWTLFPALCFAGPATFADKEREQRVAEVYNPLNPAGAVSGFSKELQMDPALARVMKPNMYCRGPGGGLISGCGLAATSTAETADWSGGVKSRAVTVTSPNGLRSDLMMASAMANQYTSFLASPVTQIATTYIYADAGAAAGVAQGLNNIDGARAAYEASIANLHAQAASDPIVGDQVAQALNGCINTQLSGAANGNQAQALTICLGDRTLSAGNFAAGAGAGAKLGDIPDHAPTGGVGINQPPAVPENQHSVWSDIFTPIIRAAPISGSGTQATKSDYINLLADAKRLTGDVIYTETNQLGSLLKSSRRERNSTASDQPDAIFYDLHRRAWNTFNGLLKKQCEHHNSYSNISPSAYDPYSWWTGLGGAKDFWDSLTTLTSQWTRPTHAELRDLSFQSFRFTAIGADLLFAQFLSGQEFVNPPSTTGQDPATADGRTLVCNNFDTASGQPGEFSRLLSTSGTGASYSLAKLKEWRQSLFEVTMRIALGQWLGMFRVMHYFLMSAAPVASSVAGVAGVSYSLAEQMIFETVGVKSYEQLEESFKLNRDELRGKFKLFESKYAAELGRGSGSISAMFVDTTEKSVGSASSFDRGTGGGS